MRCKRSTSSEAGAASDVYDISIAPRRLGERWWGEVGWTDEVAWVGLWLVDG